VPAAASVFVILYQYLYFCTSKAIKLSVPCSIVVAAAAAPTNPQISGTQVLQSLKLVVVKVLENLKLVGTKLLENLLRLPERLGGTT
jgi:hypothetical protein